MVASRNNLNMSGLQSRRTQFQGYNGSAKLGLGSALWHFVWAGALGSSADRSVITHLGAFAKLGLFTCRFLVKTRLTSGVAGRRGDRCSTGNTTLDRLSPSNRWVRTFAFSSRRASEFTMKPRSSRPLLSASSPDSSGVRPLLWTSAHHHGFYSLLAAHHNPAIRILACEPIPQTAEILARNIRDHRLAGCTIHRCAISSTTGHASIHRSMASDNCSFCPHPNAPPIGTETVETRTIDSLLSDVEPGPLLIKIDTDGHEWEILAGMTETFKRFADLALVIEFNPKMIRAAGRQPADLLARLDELGLAVFLLDDTRRLAYRIDQKTDWTTLMKPGGYANLYCRPRTLALHVALFSHSAALGGAERSLLELTRELIDDHWCVVSAVCPGQGPLVEELAKIGAATLVAHFHWWCGPAAEASTIREWLSHDIRNVAPQVTSVLRRLDPDVIWTQTLTIPWGVFLPARCTSRMSGPSANTAIPIMISSSPFLAPRF